MNHKQNQRSGGFNTIGLVFMELVFSGATLVVYPWVGMVVAICVGATAVVLARRMVAPAKYVISQVHALLKYRVGVIYRIKKISNQTSIKPTPKQRYA